MPRYIRLTNPVDWVGWVWWLEIVNTHRSNYDVSRVLRQEPSAGLLACHWAHLIGRDEGDIEEVITSSQFNVLWKLYST